MLRQSHTAVIERNVRWDGDWATEPYEAAWAIEAIAFVRVLERRNVDRVVSLRTQISPDGIHWCDEGGVLTGKGVTAKLEPEEIPGLVWRKPDGAIAENGIAPPPEFDLYPMDYHAITRSVIKYKDFESILPSYEWLDYPITMARSCKGCTENCIICGGSKWSVRTMEGRKKPSYRTPEQLAADLLNIAKFSRGPVFILGDLLQAGEEYASEFLDRIGKNKYGNPTILELFNPAPEWFFKKVLCLNG